jgi:hypothetical protein
MEIHLSMLPSMRGSYDINKDKISNDLLPKRMCYLRTEAAKSYLGMTDATIILSDVYRTGEASLAARKMKRGVASPAYSGHNYGISWDVDVEGTLKANGWAYADLLNYMQSRGWYCHRRDGSRGSEDWHFNYLGDYAQEILAKIKPSSSWGKGTWSLGAELVIQKFYGASFVLTPTDVQSALKKLRLYSGDADGKIGPISQAAIKLFASTWEVSAAHTDVRFQRTLAFIAADYSITDVSGNKLQQAWV